MKTLRMIAVGLMIAAVMGITGCKVVNFRLDVSAAGIEVHAGVAEFDTSAKVELPDLPFTGDEKEDD